MTKEELISFEKQVAEEFEMGLINGPIHLSGGNEEVLIDIFKKVSRSDWVFSTWRNHYHALLHGVPKERVLEEIRKGKSMNMFFPEHGFFTSAIVGGTIPIALGVAAAIKRDSRDEKVWCFIGDMAAQSGVFYESINYATRHELPVEFVVEDNGYSCNTPTSETTETIESGCMSYRYQRDYPHCGIGKWVNF